MPSDSSAIAIPAVSLSFLKTKKQEPLTHGRFWDEWLQKNKARKTVCSDFLYGDCTLLTYLHTAFTPETFFLVDRLSLAIHQLIDIHRANIYTFGVASALFLIDCNLEHFLLLRCRLKSSLASTSNRPNRENLSLRTHPEPLGTRLGNQNSSPMSNDMHDPSDNSGLYRQKGILLQIRTVTSISVVCERILEAMKLHI